MGVPHSVQATYIERCTNVPHHIRYYTRDQVLQHNIVYKDFSLFNECSDVMMTSSQTPKGWDEEEELDYSEVVRKREERQMSQPRDSSGKRRRECHNSTTNTHWTTWCIFQQNCEQRHEF